MNIRSTPHRRVACAAVLLTTSLIATAPLNAQPLQIDPGGQGQVLLYPYYTVRNGLSTLLTLHNGSTAAKAIRLRLREAHNGRTTLSLNIYLRPFEEWQATIIDSEQGPELRSIGGCVFGVDGEANTFLLDDDAYTGDLRDHPEGNVALSDTDRLRGGFIEAIEMGTLSAGDSVTEVADEVIGVRIDAETITRDCEAVAAAWRTEWATSPAQSIGLPAGALSGTAHVVNVGGGALFSVPATALANFYRDDSSPGSLHSPVASPTPDLRSADHGGHVDVLVGGTDETVRVDLPGEVADRLPDAVSLALLTSMVINRLDGDPDVAGSGDFVVALPTRHYYTDGPTAAGSLFSDPFIDDGKSCSAVLRTTTLKRGVAPGLLNGCIGTPPPRSVIHPPVCGSVEIMTLGQGEFGPLGNPSGSYSQSADTSFTIYLDFDTDKTVPPCNTPSPLPSPHIVAGGARWIGLPIIGFAAQGYLNANAQPGRIATYDSSLPHRRMPALRGAAGE